MGLTFASAVAALLLTACGSSGHPGPSANSNAEASGIKLADCMRSHGVPNFPDPGSGGGIQIPAGSGINPQSPAFQAAQNACQKFGAKGGPVRGGAGSEARRVRLLKLAECMRSHGIASFPDPTAGPPPQPPAGGGIAFGSPGSFIAVPQTLIDSPGFQQAAAACGFPGMRGGPPKHSAILG